MKFYHWAIVAMPFVFICILLVLASGIGSSDESAYSIYDSVAFSQLKNRPLNFPALSAGERCPISHGSRDTVPRADYIFCAGCYWFGKGPVFFALSWSDQGTDLARFSLNKVPYEQRTYRAKTPWVSKPEYYGPILIRGRLLGEDATEKLRFSGDLFYADPQSLCLALGFRRRVSGRVRNRLDYCGIHLVRVFQAAPLLGLLRALETC